MTRPSADEVENWIRRNEAARSRDRQRDAARPMEELLEETVRLSRVVSELEENLSIGPDVRAG